MATSDQPPPEQTAEQVTPGRHPAAGARLLGLEDAAERGRARPLHRARASGPARRRGAARAARPAPARRARLPRRAGRARHARARRDGRYANTPDDRPVPRPRQAVLRRRHPGDGQRPALPVLGLADRGAAHRRAAERGQGRRRGLLRGALRRPGAAGAVPRRDDRPQPRRGAWRSPRSSRGRDYRTVVDVGAPQGALPVQVALAHPHLTGGGFDLPPVGPIFEEYVAAHRPRATACASRPATSSPTRCPRPTCW